MFRHSCVHCLGRSRPFKLSKHPATNILRATIFDNRQATSNFMPAALRSNLKTGNSGTTNCLL